MPESQPSFAPAWGHAHESAEHLYSDALAKQPRFSLIHRAAIELLERLERPASRLIAVDPLLTICADTVSALDAAIEAQGVNLRAGGGVAVLYNRDHSSGSSRFKCNA